MAAGLGKKREKADSKVESSGLPADAALRWKFYESIVLNLTKIGCILASALPLWMLYLCAREVAGKQTGINMGVTWTVSLAGVAAAIKAYWLHHKMGRQREELIRLRERCRILEGRPEPETADA
jgi:hypothetical protein